MADRYPLIVNTGAAQIQELASGDNLNLTGSSISAVASITASGQITVNSGANVTAIANGASSGVGNIGATGAVFNTVFATATIGTCTPTLQKTILQTLNISPAQWLFLVDRQKLLSATSAMTLV
jgi:hypothetical protein